MGYFKKHFKNTVCYVLSLNFLFWFYKSNAQSNNAKNMIPVEDIYRHYPLDEVNVTELTNSDREATINGTINILDDGWYASSGSFEFAEIDSYVNLKNFVPDKTAAPNGFSISFWVKVSQIIGRPSGDNSVFPYLEDDQRSQIFYGRTGTNATDKTLFGTRRIRDRFVLNRYATTDNDVKNELEFWLWNPASLKTDDYGTDWHYVTIVYRWAGSSSSDAINEDYPSNMMQIYVGTPDGNLHCRANYFAPQDISSVTEWGLGNPHGKSIDYLDDFIVFSSPLSKGQVNHYFESAHNYKTTYRDDLATSTPADDGLDGEYYYILNQDNKCLSSSKNSEFEWLETEGEDSSVGYSHCSPFEANKSPSQDQNSYTFSSFNGLNYLDLNGYGFDQTFKISKDPIYLNLYEVDNDDGEFIFKKKQWPLKASLAQSIKLVNTNSVNTSTEGGQDESSTTEMAVSTSHEDNLGIIVGTTVVGTVVGGLGLVAIYKNRGSLGRMFSRSSPNRMSPRGWKAEYGKSEERVRLLESCK